MFTLALFLYLFLLNLSPVPSALLSSEHSLSEVLFPWVCVCEPQSGPRSLRCAGAGPWPRRCSSYTETRPVDLQRRKDINLACEENILDNTWGCWHNAMCTIWKWCETRICPASVSSTVVELCCTYTQMSMEHHQVVSISALHTADYSAASQHINCKKAALDTNQHAFSRDYVLKHYWIYFSIIQGLMCDELQLWLASYHSPLSLTTISPEKWIDNTKLLCIYCLIYL